MGFPLVCYCVAVPEPVRALCKLLDVAKLALLLALSALGLYRFPYAHQDGHSQLLRNRRRAAEAEEVPLPSAVKAQLPAVEFGQLSEQSAARFGCRKEEEAAATCMVCLESVEAKDKARRLGNCAHAFHVDCIDRWIDLGKVTCPLCRSRLLPRKQQGPLVSLGCLANLWTRVRR